MSNVTVPHAGQSPGISSTVHTNVPKRENIFRVLPSRNHCRTCVCQITRGSALATARCTIAIHYCYRSPSCWPLPGAGRMAAAGSPGWCPLCWLIVESGSTKDVLHCRGGETLAQVVLRSRGCSIPGDVQGQVGRGSEQPRQRDGN